MFESKTPIRIVAVVGLNMLGILVAVVVVGILVVDVGILVVVVGIRVVVVVGILVVVGGGVVEMGAFGMVQMVVAAVVVEQVVDKFQAKCEFDTRLEPRVIQYRHAHAC